MSTLLILAAIPASVALVCWQGWQWWDARQAYKADMDRLDQWATAMEQRMKGAA